MDYGNYLSLYDLYCQCGCFILYAHSVRLGAEHLAVRSCLYRRKCRVIFPESSY